jgi:MFS family permease
MIPFSATLRSEWTKLVHLRATRVTNAFAVVLAIGMTAVAAIVAGATWHHWGPADRRDFEPIGFSLIGGLLSFIPFAVVGVTAATSEYTTGMIRLTLTATPRRERVLAAKALSVAGVSLAAGLVSIAGMFLVAQAIFASYGIHHASLGDADALRTVLATAVLSPVLPVTGMVFGFALRSTAGAITATLAWVFVPPILDGVLPRWLRDHVLAYLPGRADEALSTGHLAGSTVHMAPALAVLIIVAWLAALLAGAWALLERRDA